MLKLTTNKHEASRGLSATAELLVTMSGVILNATRELTAYGDVE